MKKLLIALIIAACGSNSFAYYQAQQGRWMSRDPIAEKGGMNIYGMVGNNPISQYDLLGMSFWDYGQFLRWLGNTPDEAEHVNWGIIDPDGTGKHLLRQGWIVSNKDWFRATCNNANTGHSEYGPRLSRFERNSILNRKHAWISRWNGSVSLAEGGVGLDKSSSTCKCTFEFGLDFKARDQANFNEGERFGLFNMMHDDWFLWLQEHSILGGDYLIWSDTYSLENLEISYEK